MKNQEFNAFCSTLLASLHQASGDDEYKHESFDTQIEFFIDGYRIALYYEAEKDAAIACYVDIAQIDAALAPEIFARLLEINLEIDGLYGESLGYDRATGHLVLRAALPLALCGDVSDVTENLRAYAVFAADLNSLLLEHMPQTPEDEILLGELA